MREILFRGKRADNGEWIEGYYAKKSNHACFAHELKYQHFIFKDVCLDFNLGGLQEFEIIPETVGQYTGLTDKNGRMIFEGDIINAYHNRDLLNVSYVVFDRGEFLCELISGSFIDCCETLPEQEMECGIEIIGNIYDNPNY